MSFVNKAKQQANDYIQGKGSNAMNSTMSAVATGVGSALNSGISGGLSSGAGNVIGGLGKLAGDIPGPYGAAASVALQAVGGLVNRTFGSSLNQDNINAVNNNITALTGFQSNVNSFDELNQNIASSPLEMDFNESFIGKDGWASNTAKNTYNRLKAKQGLANAFKENSITNNLGNISTEQSQDLLAQPFGFGGSLTTHGAEFPTGLISINNGGSHEENPYDGVQMGVDSQGIPNLVEEGETIYNDYVFSNRLKAYGGLLDTVNLPNRYKNKTFAEVSKKLAEESEERPNDPISKRGFDDSMMKLQMAQEYIRAKNQAGQKGRKYKNGGKMGNLFWDGSEMIKTSKGLTSLNTPNVGTGIFDREQVFNPTTSYKGLAVANPHYTLANPDYSVTPMSFNDMRTLWGEKAPKVKGKKENSENNSDLAPTWMRYAPVAGSTLGLMWNLFNKPEYDTVTRMEKAAEAAANFERIKSNPFGDYLTYKPFDRQYATNLLNAQSGATRRGIINTSGGNRGAAMAGLLAADYNAGNQLGNLFRQAEESNQAQREKVATFNRATNQANAEMALRADMANQATRQQAMGQYMSGIAQTAALKNAIDSQRNTSINSNMSNLFSSLGAIGKENMTRNMINTNQAWKYLIGSKGESSYKKAKGGYLTINKKKRRNGKL